MKQPVPPRSWPLRVLRRAWRVLPQSIRYGVGPLLASGLDGLVDWGLGLDTTRSKQPDEAQIARTRFRDPLAGQATSYISVWMLLARLKLSNEDVFVDLGCGAGRVTLAAARSGVARSVGVECDPEVLNLARQNLSRCDFEPGRVVFLARDAAEYRFHDETVIYLFNPFGRDTLAAMLQNLRESLDRNPRALRIAYRNPVHADIFGACKWLELLDARTVGWGRAAIYAYVRP